MKLLEDKILAEGIAESENILKVDSFINHQVDPELMKKMGKSEYRQMKKLQEGTKAETFSMDIFFQKLYMIYINKLELQQLAESEQIYI